MIARIIATGLMFCTTTLLQAMDDKIRIGYRVMCTEDCELESPAKTESSQIVQIGDVLKCAEVNGDKVLVYDDTRYGYLPIAQVMSLSDPNLPIWLEHKKLPTGIRQYAKGMYFSRLDPIRAGKHFLTCLTISEHARARLEWAILLQFAGETKAAEKEFSKVVANQPELIQAQIELGQITKDEKLLRTLTKKHPNCHGCWKRLGYHYMKSGSPNRLIDASDAILKATYVCKHDSLAHSLAATIDCQISIRLSGSLRKTALTRAKSFAVRAFELDPTNFTAGSVLGDALILEGKKGSAFRAWQTALAIDPLNPFTIGKLAEFSRSHNWNTPLKDNKGKAISQREASLFKQIYQGLHRATHLDPPAKYEGQELKARQHGYRRLTGVTRDVSGLTVLHHLVLARNISGMQYLGNFCSLELNAGDSVGNTPLHLAVINQDFVFVKFLITQGANPNAKNKDGKTAVDLAISNGNPAVIHCLLLNDALAHDALISIAKWMNFEGKPEIVALREESYEQLHKALRGFLLKGLLGEIQYCRRCMTRVDQLKKQTVVRSTSIPRTKAPIDFPEGYYTDRKQPYNNAHRRLMRKLNEESRQQHAWEQSQVNQRLENLRQAESEVRNSQQIVRDTLMKLDVVWYELLDQKRRKSLLQEYKARLDHGLIDIGIYWRFGELAVAR